MKISHGRRTSTRWLPHSSQGDLPQREGLCWMSLAPRVTPRVPRLPKQTCYFMAWRRCSTAVMPPPFRFCAEL